MPRATTTSDIFNAIAEPRRREIIGLLSNGQRWSVTQVVDAIAHPQPAVSKHLAVLKAVGVVDVEKAGKERLYFLKPEVLKPVHDWVKPYEKLWDTQLARIKARAEQKAADRAQKN
ncbi:ArsR/SmtB family transcription factor [Lacunimicrobium album]